MQRLSALELATQALSLRLGYEPSASSVRGYLRNIGWIWRDIWNVDNSERARLVAYFARRNGMYGAGENDETEPG